MSDAPQQIEPPPGPATTSLSLLGDERLDPVFWPSPRPTVQSAWYGHVPFAHWLVTALRPGIIVELGTHGGVSYSAFCEAVLRSRLNTRCVAVDTWRGDAHAGHYGEEVFREVTALNESRYAAFSTLLRATFDEALAEFEDGSIDLLHIDGFHTYEAVRHDFETWLPKLGRSAVVLLHDIAVVGMGFGVHQLWAELSGRYPNFAFVHSAGLGLVATGSEIPAPVAALCALPAAEAARVRERFARLGELHQLRSSLAIAMTLMRPAAAPAPAAPPESPPEPPAEPRPVKPARAYVAPEGAGIAVLALPEVAEPVPELEDIWDGVAALLRHMEQFNESEAAVQEQQHGIVLDGCFLLPSPVSDGTADTCLQSYYVPHRFYYRFDAAEEYFWITGALDDAYALSAIYFPERRVALTLRPGGISEAELLEFERVRAEVSKPEPGPVPSEGKRLVVTGFPHAVHTLWNELPALERAAAEGLGPRMKIAAAYSPFGPLTEILPQLDVEVRPFFHDQTAEINSENALIAGLGSLTITQSILTRVRDVALRYTDPAAIAARAQFRATCSPIFWLSVQPPPRTVLRQADMLARLIALIRERYPQAGFVLNGTSGPWDAESNPNYAGWFNEELSETSALTAVIVADVLEQLDREQRDAVRVVSDVSVCEEITWGAIADFYFCHFGVMQNKIGWTQPVRGMVHTSSHFRDSFEAQARVVENGPPSYLIPAHLVDDVDVEAEAALEGEREEGNYRFPSVEAVADAVLAAYTAGEGAPENAVAEQPPEAIGEAR